MPEPRQILLALVTIYFVMKTFRQQLWPHGTAVYLEMDERPHEPVKLDKKQFFPYLVPKYDNWQRLDDVESSLEFLWKHNTEFYGLTRDSTLVQWSPNEATKTLAHLGRGRPLDGATTSDGVVYIADAILGLLRVTLDDTSAQVHVVVSHVANKPLTMTSSVVVGPKTGTIYFTDATDLTPDRKPKYNRTTMDGWDLEYSGKIDALRGKPTGRLLAYNPVNDQVSVVAEGLAFPTGLAVDAAETEFMIAEAWGYRLSKYSLETNELQVWVDRLPGYPTALDCGRDSCFAALPSGIVPLARMLRKLPNPLDLILRNLFMLAPKVLLPGAKTYGGIAEVDWNNHTKFRVLQDPKAKYVSAVTGVALDDHLLYFCASEFCGVYDLQHENTSPPPASDNDETAGSEAKDETAESEAEPTTKEEL